MAEQPYHEGQPLDRYVEMLHDIYGLTQNYAKSKYEILSHLSEVCGITGKFIVKKNDLDSASRFIPKIFGWACALLSAVNPHASLQSIIIQKFPGVCPYCQASPCTCWKTEKPSLNPQALQATYYKYAPSLPKNVNDLELMFTAIYQSAWNGKDGSYRKVEYIYLRLIEELAEVSESVRLHHLYPKNFENELADFFAWWFALSRTLRELRDDHETQSEALLWRAYPGHCRDCQSIPCFCQQGPVRELISKPSPGQYHEIDALTSLRNQGAYNTDIGGIAVGKLTFALPISCVRCDVDKFKEANDTYGHFAGDLALKHIASVLRSKSNIRHRVYRISGDEFGLMMPDCTEEEAAGMMKRVLATLAKSPVEWTSAEGKAVEFNVSMSIGVAQCDDPALIIQAFEHADQACYGSKAAGRGRVMRATDLQTTDSGSPDGPS